MPPLAGRDYQKLRLK